MKERAEIQMVMASAVTAMSNSTATSSRKKKRAINDGDQALFKTPQQDSEHIDTYHISLSLAMRYLFSTMMSLFSSKL